MAKMLTGVSGVVVADNRDQAAIADGFAAFVALARQQRAYGYPAECSRRGEVHDYSERAARMDVLLHQVLGYNGASRHGGDTSSPG
jgi:hypothetical protein